jgi:hypothetical protein
LEESSDLLSALYSSPSLLWRWGKVQRSFRHGTALVPCAFGTLATDDPVLATLVIGFVIFLQVFLYIIASLVLAKEITSSQTGPDGPTRLRDNPTELFVRGIFSG